MSYRFFVIGVDNELVFGRKRHDQRRHKLHQKRLRKSVQRQTPHRLPSDRVVLPGHTDDGGK